MFVLSIKEIMRILFVLVFAGFFVCNSCNQQKTDWIDRSKHEGLHNITLSDKFETYATEVQPANLENTIKNLELAKAYFDKIFDENLNFAVLFVDNQNWDKYAFTPPPGMPQAHHEGNIILGINKSVMANGFEQALSQMPPQATQELKKYFGEPINLDKFFRDCLALHELGHLYQFYKTSKSSQRNWLNELFGNLCQVAAAKSFKNQTTFKQMDSYQNLLIRGNQWGELNYKTLQQFENNYFDVLKSGRNYGWYQTQFYTMAKELYSKYGDSLVTKFRTFLIDTDVQKLGELNDVELNEIIKKTFGEDVLSILKWDYPNSSTD
ncbi:hypothetical protein BFR04_01565 [Gaetbulibacter sp. 4G1]|nr:hypothetical protein BFR04_01565 [Gaetbulibacter sp. 4G1]